MLFCDVWRVSVFVCISGGGNSSGSGVYVCARARVCSSDDNSEICTEFCEHGVH